MSKVIKEIHRRFVVQEADSPRASDWRFLAAFDHEEEAMKFAVKVSRGYPGIRVIDRGVRDA